MPVMNEELRAELERMLGRSVVDLERRPYDYTTSFALEELGVCLTGDERLNLIFKNVGPDALSPSARETKPEFLYDPVREIAVYREILESRDLGTARCHGSVVDPRAKRYWLFLEKVPGLELYQIGELERWQAAMRWLARMHTHLAGVDHERLLRYDARFLRLWAPRARSFDGFDSPVYADAVERLAALPPTFVHGELYSGNVLVAGSRVCPIDWEMAGVGPAVIDVAAITTGWEGDELEALTHAYLEGLASPPQSDEFERDLDCARLHLAVRWLGWSRHWTPPPKADHDWAGEAHRAAARLDGHPQDRRPRPAIERPTLKKESEAAPEARSFFEAIWQEGDHWELETSSYDLARYQLYLDMIGDRRYPRVLELGCGAGAFTRRLASLADAVVGIDVAPAAIDRARSLPNVPAGVAFQVGDAMEYDANAEGPWDLIVFSETIAFLGWLHPFYKIFWFAYSLFESLRPGGRLLIGDTYQEWDGIFDPRIIRSYRDVLAAVGLRLEREETFRAPKDGWEMEALVSLFEKPA